MGVSDYERIAGVIRYLEENFQEQPSLSDLAGGVGLSDSHFHRLFARWAGVTPKEFLQCLTHAHARKRLEKGDSVLDAALDAGLSGPGRLHDLCVKLEAATPGELKSGGVDLRIEYGFAESPFGRIFLAQGPRGICHLSFVDAMTDKDAVEVIRESWPLADFERNDLLIESLSGRIFRSDRSLETESPIRAYVVGTAFQVKVWEALLRIPYGDCATYKQVATSLGKPTASRAVGNAIGRNALAYLLSLIHI